jgi:hypothetical protein
MELRRIDIKKLLEGSGTVDYILGKLTENPHTKFLDVFSYLRESKIATHYSDSILYISSSDEEYLVESLPVVQGLLKERNIEVQKCSEILDEGIRFTIEINLLKKHVDRFCNG